MLGFIKKLFNYKQEVLKNYQADLVNVPNDAKFLFDPGPIRITDSLKNERKIFSRLAYFYDDSLYILDIAGGSTLKIHFPKITNAKSSYLSKYGTSRLRFTYKNEKYKIKSPSNVPSYVQKAFPHDYANFDKNLDTSQVVLKQIKNYGLK